MPKCHNYGSESQIQRSIREAVNAIPGVRFWRNNVGGYAPSSGRWVEFGLAPGSADLVGMVDGWFAAIEVKTPVGRLSKNQKLWAAAVQRLGGHVAVCRSVEDALTFVRGVRALHASVLGTPVTP